jgi:hypothetical protein
MVDSLPLPIQEESCHAYLHSCGQILLRGPRLARRLFLAGSLCAAMLHLAMAQSAPGNYTIGDLVFPRQPPPQYVVVDLGLGTVVDMNDNGDVLVNDFVDEDTYTLWSGGVATAVPTSDEDGNEYDWYFVANDGEVLGLFYGADYSEGLARWNSTDGVSFIADDDEPGFLTPDDADYWFWPYDFNFTRDGSIYVGVQYGVQEVLAYDYYCNPVGPDNFYYKEFRWSPHGAGLTQVGDAIFIDGDEGAETPGASISQALSTDADGNTLSQIHEVTTYAYPEYTEIDYEFCGEVFYTSVTGLPFDPSLQLNGVDVPNSYFGDTSDTGVLLGLNYPVLLNNYAFSPFDGTVLYLNGDSFVSVNLTANADSDASLYFYQIDSLGLALDNNGLLWLNGAELPWADILPPADLNMDGWPNITAMLPAAGLSPNTSWSLPNLAQNSTAIAGVAHDDDSGNYESFLLVPAALAVDNNRDGNISFDVDDQTSEDNPFVFWLNNDVDRYHAVDVNAILNPDGYWIEDSLDPTLGSNIDITDNVTSYRGKVDWQLNNIPSERDLKDFARLWLNFGALQSAIASGNIYVGLKWVPPTGNTTFDSLPQPAIKLYVATESDGGSQYLTDPSTAEDQLISGVTVGGNLYYAIPDISGVAANSTIVAPPASGTRDYDFVLPKEIFANVTTSNSTIHFLFEGCAAGQGQLSVVLLTYNGTGYTEISSAGGGVSFDLEDIKNLYERWTVGQGNGNITESAGTATLPAASANLSTNLLPDGQMTAFAYDDDHLGLSVSGDADENKYILFVHGWNQPPWERDAFAETMLKSLYWQRYKGKFGMFEWPTTYGYSGVLMPASFDIGDYIAFASAAPLASLLGSLYSTYQEEDETSDVYVMAHSHGNLVVGEALRMAGQAGGSDIVNTYVAAQAAIPAEAYDPSMVSSASLSFGVTNVTIPGYLTLPLSGNFGPGTADIFSGWIAPGNSTPAVSAKANFYNTNDWALNLWNTNEIIKPIEDEPQTFTGTFDGYSATLPLWDVLEIAGGGFSGYVTELPGNTSVYDMAPYGYSGNIAGPVNNSGNLFYKTQYWTSNNTLDGSNYTLFLDTGAPQGNLTNLPNRYDVMSFDGESRSLALGEVSASIAGFSSQDLQSLWPATDPLGATGVNAYNEHPWHSGEFRFDFALQHTYWGTLTTKFGLTPLYP